MANWITFIRVLLSLLVAGLLFIHTETVYWLCFGLTVVVVWMDGLDGYVARKFQETSEFGAVFDILADRIVEQVYWLVFLALGWVPVWMALVVIIRGVLVDGFRSIALKEGYTAFGQTSMMQSPIGVLLVSSRFSRWTYAFFKAAAFSFTIVAMMPNGGQLSAVMLPFAIISLWITLIFCVLRGLPVLVESRRFFA